MFGFFFFLVYFIIFCLPEFPGKQFFFFYFFERLEPSAYGCTGGCLFNAGGKTCRIS